MLHPRSGAYTFAAYLGGLSGAILGFNETSSLRNSTLRWILLVGLVPLAIYGILQRVLPLPFWDQSWLDSIDFNSIGTGDGVHVRVFASLNAPGTLGPLLGWGLLCYLTGTRNRLLVITGATVLALALALTYVRAAWLALAVAALAYVIGSRGRALRLVLGSFAVIAATTVALSPVSVAARNVLTRATTFTALGGDASYTARASTIAQTLPPALAAPLGHGLGSAGEQSRLDNPTALQTPDDGYLALVYQVGPVGFILVVLAIASVTASAWRLARAGIAGDLSVLLFAMIVFTLVLLTSGDAFYGVTGVLFWFICGQILGIEYRTAQSRSRKIT